MLFRSLVMFAVAGAAQAGVKIGGKNDQSVDVTGAVLNAAFGAKATAKQNLASNAGDVKIGGDNKQSVKVKGAVINAAIGPMATAKQNLASNTSDQ